LLLCDYQCTVLSLSPICRIHTSPKACIRGSQKLDNINSIELLISLHKKCWNHCTQNLIISFQYNVIFPRHFTCICAWNTTVDSRDHNSLHKSKCIHCTEHGPASGTQLFKIITHCHCCISFMISDTEVINTVWY